MSKSLFWSLSLFFFLGCAHTHVEQWSGNQMEICGNKWANIQSMREKAIENGCKNPIATAGRMLRDGSVQIEQNAVTGKPNGVSASAQQCTMFTCGK